MNTSEVIKNLRNENKEKDNKIKELQGMLEDRNTSLAHQLHEIDSLKKQNQILNKIVWEVQCVKNFLDDTFSRNIEGFKRDIKDDRLVKLKV